jgi:peptide deformylase
MTLLKIARMGHPALIRRAEDVTDPTARDIRRLVEDMIETMDDGRGVGLAAPQVHVGRRVIIFKAPPERTVDEDEDEPDASATSALTELINPSFEPLGDDTALGWEGCLSIPGITGAVPRFTRIRYRGMDISGRAVEREASGFHARVVQHEIDHLDGVLFPMRMTDLSLLSFNEELRHFAETDRPGEDGDELE